MASKLRYISPCFFALAIARAWTALLFSAPEAQMASIQSNTHLLFDCTFTAAALGAALASNFLSPLSAQKWSRPLVLGLMLSSSLSFVAITLFPNAATPFAIAGSLLGGAGFALFLLMYSESLVKQGFLYIIIYLSGSQLIATALTVFCRGLDLGRISLVVIVLPLWAVYWLRQSWHSATSDERYDMEPESSNAKTPEARLSASFPLAPSALSQKSCPSPFPWKIIALSGVYAFVYGLHSQSFVESAGMHASISTALVSGLLFVSVILFSDKFNFSLLYRSPLLLMVCGLLIIPAEAFIGSSASSYLVSMSYTLMKMLIGLILYSMSKRFGIAILALFGARNATQIFTNIGEEASSVVSTLGIDLYLQDVLISTTGVVLMLLATILLFSEKELTKKWGVSIVDAKGIASDPSAAWLDKRCNELTRIYQLSPREDEVLRQLASGRPTSLIAKELFVAEGTLRAHMHHIYEKTGINSRKELEDLIGI